MSFTRRISVAAIGVALLAPLPAQAQSQLDRMEALSERAGALTNEALVLQMPELRGNLPDPEWDDSLRQAYSCVLDGYVSASSEGAVDQMLDEMDSALSDATGESILNGEMSDAIAMPAGMDPARGQALMNECGVMNIMMTRMAESGAMEIMMQQ